jgi:hypothetical protein
MIVSVLAKDSLLIGRKYSDLILVGFPPGPRDVFHPDHTYRGPESSLIIRKLLFFNRLCHLFAGASKKNCCQ